MNKNINFTNLTDIFDKILKNTQNIMNNYVAEQESKSSYEDKAEDDIETNNIESSTSSIKYTAAMPVKAIFNVKTEKMIPVLDKNGNIMYEDALSENQPKRILRKAIKLKTPILASKVFFEDGTWTVVKNAEEDPVELVNIKLPNGNTVVTASNGSKERALVYAIAKHAFGVADPITKEVTCANLSRRFEKVLENSIDQQIIEAKSKIKAKTTNKPLFKKPLPTKSTKPAFKSKLIDDLKEQLDKEQLDKFLNTDVSKLIETALPDLINIITSQIKEKKHSNK